MKPVFVETIAVLGPGLPDWPRAAEVLRNPACYDGIGGAVEAGSLLTAAERRRTTPTIRLALHAARQVANASSLDLSKAASVFASSVGDLDILDGVCSALRAPNPPVSPAQFQHIVHNAAAGYWSVAARSTALSTSLSAGDGTFAAGLVEAMTTLLDGNDPVLLVCYDQPGPAVLARYLPVAAPFAVAMALTTQARPGCCCSLEAVIAPGESESVLGARCLEPLRLGNAAARALPLLELIAQGEAGRVCLPYIGDSCLRVEAMPVAAAAQSAEEEERIAVPRQDVPAEPVPALALSASAP